VSSTPGFFVELLWNIIIVSVYLPIGSMKININAFMIINNVSLASRVWLLISKIFSNDNEHCVDMTKNKFDLGNKTIYHHWVS
jgi:hypothetical protein